MPPTSRDTVRMMRVIVMHCTKQLPMDDELHLNERMVEYDKIYDIKRMAPHQIALRAAKQLLSYAWRVLETRLQCRSSSSFEPPTSDVQLQRVWNMMNIVST